MKVKLTINGRQREADVEPLVFFRGSYGDQPGDLIYFQGHASPGVYARAFLEGGLFAVLQAFGRSARTAAA